METGQWLFLILITCGICFGIGIGISRLVMRQPRPVPVWLRWLDPLDGKTEQQIDEIFQAIGLRRETEGSGPSPVKCACGCGRTLHYAGTGRKPKYYNENHKHFAHGRRLSPD